MWIPSWFGLSSNYIAPLMLPASGNIHKGNKKKSLSKSIIEQNPRFPEDSLHPVAVLNILSSCNRVQNINHLFLLL